MFVVVPHIVRSQELDQANLRVDRYRRGAVDRVAAYGRRGARLPTPARRARGCGQPRWSSPAVGAVPAQSAIEAAPQMLAQLRARRRLVDPANVAQAAAQRSQCPRLHPPACAPRRVRPAHRQPAAGSSSAGHATRRRAPALR